MCAESTAELLELLESENRHARAVAAIKLGQGKVAEALPRLRKLADDKDDIIALAGMYACWKLGEDRVSIERVITAVSSEDEEVVQQAVQTVTAFGDFLIPKLVPLINQSPELTTDIVNLLELVGGPGALDVIKSINTDDPEVVELINEIIHDWDHDTPGELN